MARPFDQFPQVVSSLEKRINRTIKRTTQESALEADRVAIRETPVDTGLARSNWIASIGTPAANVIPPYSPGMNRGKGERGNAAGARAQAEQVIRGWNPGDPSIFIANNVPYIVILEQGTANRSPNMMARMAIQAAVQKARRVFVSSFRAAGRLDRFLR